MRDSDLGRVGVVSMSMPQSQLCETVVPAFSWDMFFFLFSSNYFFQKHLEGEKIMKYACRYGLWAPKIKQNSFYKNEKRDVGSRQ